MNDNNGPIWAVVAALVTGLLAYLAQGLRGQTDQTVEVMKQWKELLAAHELAATQESNALKERIVTIEKEFAAFRQQASEDMAELRKMHSREIEEIRSKHAAEMQQMREENAGLKRIIDQNAKSTAQLLGTSPVSTPLNRAYPPVEDDER